MIPIGTRARSIMGMSLFSRNMKCCMLLSGLAQVLISANLSDLRVRVTLRLAVYRQSVRLGAKPLRITTSNFIFQPNICGYSTPWREDGSAVYNCCWPSPTQSFSGKESCEAHGHILRLRFNTPPTWRARSLYLYPPWTEWPRYTPRHFSSPPGTLATIWPIDMVSYTEGKRA
jgi:hypothetical protein